jgi:hypothetical protein
MDYCFDSIHACFVLLIEVWGPQTVVQMFHLPRLRLESTVGSIALLFGGRVRLLG